MYDEEVAIRGTVRDEMFVNIAGYRFIDLPDRDSLREPRKPLGKLEGNP